MLKGSEALEAEALIVDVLAIDALKTDSLAAADVENNAGVAAYAKVVKLEATVEADALVVAKYVNAVRL